MRPYSDADSSAGRRMIVRSLLAFLAAACGGDATGSPLVERLDSAGVPVIVNASPDSGSAVWRLSAQPTVEIGVVDGPQAYQLFRATTGAVLSDGTIVVANAGTQELRFYDGTGRHIRSVGSQGEGPGEFRTLSLLGTFAGDSLLVWDGQQLRLSVFTPDGALARSYGAPSELGISPITGGLLADGRMVALQRQIGSVGTPGVQRNAESVITVSPEGNASAPLGEFLGAEMSIFDGLGMGVVFGRRLHFHARGDKVAVGNDDDFSVRVYGADGELIQIVRQARTPVAVGDGDFERAAPLPGSTSPIRARMEGSLAQMPRHATFPAYQSLRLDAGGRLWVQDFYPPGTEGATWQIFGPDGVFLASLDVPRGIDVLELGEDHVLTRARDEMDVERVRVYRLETGRAGG